MAQNGFQRLRCGWLNEWVGCLLPGPHYSPKKLWADSTTDLIKLNILRFAKHQIYHVFDCTHNLSMYFYHYFHKLMRKELKSMMKYFLHFPIWELEWHNSLRIAQFLTPSVWSHARHFIWQIVRCLAYNQKASIK